MAVLAPGHAGVAVVGAFAGEGAGALAEVGVVVDSEGFDGGGEFCGSEVAEGVAVVCGSGVVVFEVFEGGVDDFSEFTAGHGEEVEGGSLVGECPDGCPG